MTRSSAGAEVGLRHGCPPAVRFEKVSRHFGAVCAVDGVSFEIVYGESDNTRSWWDNSRAAQLGYRPEDDPEDHAAEVIAREPPHDPDDPQHLYQGGVFAKVEYGGNPTKQGS